MSNMYPIEGTSNRHPEQHTGAYLDPSYWPNFQETIASFKQTLLDHAHPHAAPYSLLRVGHSERDAFYITIGKDYRHNSRSSQNATVSPQAEQDMYKSVVSADATSTQIGYDFQELIEDVHFMTHLRQTGKNVAAHFHEIESVREERGGVQPLQDSIALPLDIIYGLVANRWLFKTFAGRIGLIGAEEKLATIKKLMDYHEYREYLGTDSFTDYIPIPQKFAFDDDGLAERIKDAVSKSSCDIFLIGGGVSKLRFFHILKEARNCVYLDVGHGICMLAGYGDNTRPYCGEWVNYRLPPEETVGGIDWLGPCDLAHQVQLARK